MKENDQLSKLIHHWNEYQKNISGHINNAKIILEFHLETPGNFPTEEDISEAEYVLKSIEKISSDIAIFQGKLAKIASTTDEKINLTLTLSFHMVTTYEYLVKLNNIVSDKWKRIFKITQNEPKKRDQISNALKYSIRANEIFFANKKILPKLVLEDFEDELQGSKTMIQCYYDLYFKPAKGQEQKTAIELFKKALSEKNKNQAYHTLEEVIQITEDLKDYDLLLLMRHEQSTICCNKVKDLNTNYVGIDDLKTNEEIIDKCARALLKQSDLMFRIQSPSDHFWKRLKSSLYLNTIGCAMILKGLSDHSSLKKNFNKKMQILNLSLQLLDAALKVQDKELDLVPGYTSTILEISEIIATFQNKISHDESFIESQKLISNRIEKLNKEYEDKFNEILNSFSEEDINKTPKKTKSKKSDEKLSFPEAGTLDIPEEEIDFVPLYTLNTDTISSKNEMTYPSAENLLAQLESAKIAKDDIKQVKIELSLAKQHHAKSLTYLNVKISLKNISNAIVELTHTKTYLLQAINSLENLKSEHVELNKLKNCVRFLLGKLEMLLC